MWRRNGLSIVLFLLLAFFLVGQVWTGFLSHNQELHEAHRAGLDLWAYLHSGHFVSATFENWESEFLQMGMYVLITVRLRQKGSAESRPLKGGARGGTHSAGAHSLGSPQRGNLEASLRSLAGHRLFHPFPGELLPAPRRELARDGG